MEIRDLKECGASVMVRNMPTGLIYDVEAPAGSIFCIDGHFTHEIQADPLGLGRLLADTTIWPCGCCEEVPCLEVRASSAG